MAEQKLLTRRRLMIGAGVGAAAIAGTKLLGDVAFAEDQEASVSMTWLGTNAWLLRSPKATVLIDPWVSRFPTGAYQDGGADPDTPIEVYPEVIDEHVPEADCVLVTHGHYDHIADVPHIARRTGATVLGNETHLNLLRAMETPEAQLGQVSGGEYYAFDGFTVEVFRSTHAPSGEHKTITFGGSRVEKPKRPKKIKDLVEGGSLTYLVDFGGISFFNAGSANALTGEFSGITPTVLFMQPPGEHIADHVEGLLEATGYPPYVVPTHWDDFDEPLTEPAVPGADWKGLRDLVAKASPESEFIHIDHLESHVL